MTEAEIEAQARERAEKLEEEQTLGVYDSDEDLARDMGWNDGEVSGYEKGFIDGANWGAEHAIEWHDLRKDPNDLPKETKDYIIYHEDNTGFHHYSIRRFSHNYFDCTNTILAWCELPRFKE